jgi:DNA-binding response OmpR family regulator
VLEVGAVLLDLDRRTAQADGRPVPLTAMEFDLLAYLMSEPGRVFSRGQLLSAVWGQADYGGGRTVDVHVAQLRAKLGAASPLRTTRGVGYSASDDPGRGRP